MTISNEDERGLVRHGIGRRYHDLELEDLPGGEALLDYLGTGEFLQGGDRGISLIGGLNAYKLFQVLARKVFMRNIPTLVITASKLVDALGGDFKTLELVDDTRALFLSNLHPTIAPKDCPWLPYKRAMLTDYLESYWEDGRVTVTCMPHTMKPIPGWFGQHFVEAHNENNHSITVPA